MHRRTPNRPRTDYLGDAAREEDPSTCRVRPCARRSLGSAIVAQYTSARTAPRMPHRCPVRSAGGARFFVADGADDRRAPFDPQRRAVAMNARSIAAERVPSG